MSAANMPRMKIRTCPPTIGREPLCSGKRKYGFEEILRLIRTPPRYLRYPFGPPGRIGPSMRDRPAVGRLLPRLGRNAQGSHGRYLRAPAFQARGGHRGTDQFR